MNEQYTVIIDRLSSKGRGIATLPSEKNIEVFSALPEEKVTVTLGPKRKKKQLAFVEELLSASPYRIQPTCPHASTCGGCTYQHLSYPEQLKHKEKILRDLYPNADIRPIIPSPKIWHYRNKMEYTFSQNKAGDRFLGLHLVASKGKVFNLKECPISPLWFPKIVEVVSSWWKQSRLKAYHPPSDTGSLQTLTLRSAGDEQMVLLTVSGNSTYAIPKSLITSFKEAVCKILPNASIFLIVKQITKGNPTQYFEMHLNGPDHINETLCGLTFKISPTSFFQPNPQAAEKLFQAILDLSPKPLDHVLDLYAGTATLSCLFAAHAKKITAIELNRYAHFDAEVNREVNHIQNLDLHHGDVSETLSTLSIKPDLILLDPPRTGLTPQALKQILTLSPPHILYISCNPKTQAADIAHLCEEKYTLVTLQPVDQFPHTPHLENIALLYQT